MGLPHYLAMTPEEFNHTHPLPDKIAWMSCRFSVKDPGLCQLPQKLPGDSILVLDDSVSPADHDPAQVIRQLKDCLPDVKGVLLDFQKPGCEETAAMAKALAQELPCPVGVSECYAQGLDCPIFLPPVPLHIPLEEYLSSHKNREIWLDAALGQETLTVTENGTEFCSAISTEIPEHRFYDETLFCHYRIRLSENSVEFVLFDTGTSLQRKLAHAMSLGVKYTIGLWQEFRDF